MTDSKREERGDVTPLDCIIIEMDVGNILGWEEKEREREGGGEGERVTNCFTSVGGLRRRVTRETEIRRNGRRVTDLGFSLVCFTAMFFPHKVSTPTFNRGKLVIFFHCSSLSCPPYDLFV